MKNSFTRIVLLLTIIVCCCCLSAYNSAAQIIISGSGAPPTCAGGSNASLDITVSGGVTPYTFSWSSGQTTEDLTGIVAGSYSVTVTDAAGTSAENTFNVPDAIRITGFIDCNQVCFGQCNGVINLTILTGTGPFTYHWNTGATTEDLTGM